MSSVLIALAGVAPAAAQLVGGGLTSQPNPIYNNALSNGGFETVSGSVPAGWTPSGTWSLDQLVAHSGTFSYRLGSGGAQATQTMQLTPGTYRLSGWIKTQSSGSGSSRLTLDFRPAINSWFPTPDLAGTNDWTYQEVLVTVPDNRTATVVLDGYYATAGFQAWYDDVKLELQKPYPVSAFMLYPNFRGMLFDDQSPTLKFDVTVTPPVADFTRYQVKATLKNEATGQVVNTQTFPAAPQLTATLDGTAMPAGPSHLATIELIDLSNNTSVYTYPAYRVSKVPGATKATMNVAVDDKNRMLVHGKPRFVLGVYDSGLGYSTDPTFWENTLWANGGDRQMNGLPINFYLNYWYGAAPIDAMNALMTNLQNHGVMYLQTGNCFDHWPADNSFLINSSDTYVQQLAQHPASAGFYTIDECLATLEPGAFTQYDRLRKLDPASMTFMANFGNPDLVLWRDAVDVPSTDPYPMYGAEPAGGYNMGFVAEWTRNAQQTFEYSRPVMTVMQFFQFTSLGRWPTLPEMREHAYMAIVEGAHGLWWWSLGTNALQDVCTGWCTQKTQYMNNLKAVVGELATLEPVLLADDAPAALTTNSNSAIKTKVKVVNGVGYLFTYNSTNAAATATFTWNTAPGTITVNAENRTLTASGSSFTDSYGPFAAHVYVIANGGTGGTGGPGGGTTAPTVTFTNPAATTTTLTGTVTVTMAGSGGSGTGYTYTLAVDGTTVYNGTSGTFSWNTTAIANGSHTLTATVTDSAAQSGTANRTVTVSNTVATPPTVTFTSPSATTTTVSGTVTVTMAGSGGSGTGYTYTLAVDGTTAYNGASGTFSWNTTAIANGSHTLTATVTDSAAQSGTATRTVTVSNASTPPPPTTGTLKVAVTSPTAGATVSGTNWAVIWLSGASGTSNTYTLTAGGKTVGTTTTSSTGPVSIPWATTAVPDGAQALTVSAKDATGNTGSGSVNVTVKNGTTTPPALTTSFTSPAAGATVSGTTTVALTASGGSGTGDTYKLAIDAAAPISLSGASYAWNTTTVANGSHTLTATATDSAGHTATATRTVTVSNATVTPLAITFTAPAASATVSGSVTVTAAATGGSGYSYKLSVDGTQAATTASFSWNTTTVVNGSHTLTAAVTDSLGRTATATRTVTVSNTVAPPPVSTLQVAVTQPTGGSTVNGTNWAVVWVSGAASGNATYTLTMGGKPVGSGTTAPVGPVSVPYDTTLVADGAQTLTVSVRDSAGKTGSANVSLTVKNNTTPVGTLNVAITQPTGGAVVNGTAWVVMWVSGASGASNTFTLSVDGQTVATQTVSVAGPVTLPWVTTGSANGTHTVTAGVKDATGNTGATAVTVTVSN
ncbi:MAG TPA: Ig-like domain-containing protein [Methylomirabilota bacterium]|nr:Ig-like domain-containing protein [Methylomirabilota bacterium]